MTLPSPVYPNFSHLPGGLRGDTYEATIDMSSAAASFAIFTRPAYSTITSIAVKVPNTLNASTAVKFGVGNGSDPDAYYRSAGLTTASSTYQGLRHADTNITSAEDMKIYAVDTNGAAAGTIGGGGDDYVQVRITYEVVEGF